MSCLARKTILLFAALLLVLGFSPAQIRAQDAFITTWKTSSPNESITIPTHHRDVPFYNFTIDWGDGTTESYGGQNPDPSHTYSSAGTYTVKISGTFPRIFFGDVTDDDPNADKLQSIEQWGTGQWTNMRRAFAGANNVVSNAADAPDLTHVSTTSAMFMHANSFNADISGWDVSNVTHMSQMFKNARNFNQDIGDWDVSNVTNMRDMFAGARSFNGDIGGWDVSSVIRMNGMFAGAQSFNQDLGGWDVSSVTRMRNMFTNAVAFNQDIGEWDVSNVIVMREMFAGAASFNQDIGGWDVSNVTDMSAMFSGAKSFDQDIGGWDVSSVTAFHDDFSGGFLERAGLSPQNYDALLIGWDKLDLTDGLTLDAGESQYTDTAADERQSIIDGEGWSISDGARIGPAASASRTVTGPGTVDFGATGAAIRLSGGSGSGKITVQKFSTPPSNADSVSKTHVSTYRFTIAAERSLSFSSAEVRLGVDSLIGISDPTKVTILKREEPGSGSFSALGTTVDANGTPGDISDDTLSASVSSFSEFALASDTEGLPVELANFDAKVEDRTVHLTWQTVSEQNNSGFEVRHRPPQGQFWETLRFIESKAPGGTSTKSHSYRYATEDLAIGTHRFRLRQIDLDGSSTRAASVTVDLHMGRALRLAVPAPNPSSDGATVSFAVKEKKNTQLVLYNMLGQSVRVLYRGVPPKGESQTVRLNTGELPSGTYFLRLAAGEKTKTRRVTIVR